MLLQVLTSTILIRLLHIGSKWPMCNKTILLMYFIYYQECVLFPYYGWFSNNLACSTMFTRRKYILWIVG